MTDRSIASPSSSEHFLSVQCLRRHPFADVGLFWRFSCNGPPPVRGPNIRALHHSTRRPLLPATTAVVGLILCSSQLYASAGTNASRGIVTAHARIV